MLDIFKKKIDTELIGSKIEAGSKSKLQILREKRQQQKQGELLEYRMCLSC